MFLFVNLFEMLFKSAWEYWLIILVMMLFLMLRPDQLRIKNMSWDGLRAVLWGWGNAVLALGISMYSLIEIRILKNGLPFSLLFAVMIVGFFAWLLRHYGRLFLSPSGQSWAMTLYIRCLWVLSSAIFLVLAVLFYSASCCSNLA